MGFRVKYIKACLLKLSAIILFTSLTSAVTATEIRGSEAFKESPGQMSLKVGAKEFKIMSYNLLNLFDAKHDEGKLDHTFLPFNYPGKVINCQKLSKDYYREECLTTDWTERKVQLKVKQISKSIALQGSLPDLLAVQEIENANVAEILRKELGYEKFIITDSPDKRGIDVALFFNESKIRYIEHEEIDVTSEVGFETRNILRVHFKPLIGSTNKTIGVYVNHWPSQAAAPVARVAAAKVMTKRIDVQTDRIGKDDYHVIVVGDFNTTDDESPHVFHDEITSPYWKNHLYDVQPLSESKGNPMRFNMPPGTYWFGKVGTYSRFDRIFISRNLRDNSDIRVQSKSFRIVGTRENSREVTYTDRTSDFYPTKQYVPLRYDFNSTNPNQLGFSDHYPVVVKFQL